MGRNHKAISLFSGAGGLDCGMTCAGFEVIGACDIEAYACDTLRYNFKSAKIIGPPGCNGDLSLISPEEFMEMVGIRPGEISLLFGGPPCQPFSIASNQRYRKMDEKYKRIGFEDPRRGGLLGAYIEYVKILQPEVCLLENVPGLRDIDGGKQLAYYLAQLEEAGYTCSDPTVLKAVNFGVPQQRERLFTLAVKGASEKPKLPTEWGTRELKTVAHALATLPSSLQNHITRNHQPESIERYRRLRFGQREPLGRVDRLDPRLPGKTVIAGGTKGGGRSHLHPFIARTLSVRECARLQSFPDDFVFQGTTSRQLTQVGNAVPPLLAYGLGSFILKEVLGLQLRNSETPSPYLETDMSVGELCDKLWRQSLAEKKEWVYYDSLERNPAMGQTQGGLIPSLRGDELPRR